MVPALSFLTGASNFINLNSHIDLKISYPIVKSRVWVYINILITFYLEIYYLFQNNFYIFKVAELPNIYILKYSGLAR